MKQRIITAIGIILVVALPVALGGYWLEALALFIVCAGAYEWMHIQPDFKSWPKYVLPLSALAVILTRVLPDKYFFVVMTLIVVFLWSLVVFVENFSIIDAFVCISYVTIFSLVYHAVGQIANVHQYLWTIVFATYGSDTGAYFVGRAIGKHKMNPRISPKKSCLPAACQVHLLCVAVWQGSVHLPLLWRPGYPGVIGLHSFSELFQRGWKSFLPLSSR